MNDTFSQCVRSSLSIIRIWLRTKTTVNGEIRSQYRFFLRIGLALLAWLGIGYTGPLYAEERLSFAHVLPSQVESLGHINAIVEDRFGFIWVAGNSGLARFDGYNLRFYQHMGEDHTSLPHNTVTRLIVSDNQQLWLTTGAGLSLYREESDDFLTFVADTNDLGPSVNSLLAIADDGHRGFWLGSGVGLLHFDRQRQKFDLRPLDEKNTAILKKKPVWDIALQANNNVLLATYESGLQYFPTQSRQLSELKLNLRKPRITRDVRSVFVDREERIWAGTYRGGVYMKTELSDASTTFTDIAGLTPDVTWTIVQDKQGTIWLGDGNGLSRVDLANRKLIRHQHDPLEPNSLASSAVREIFQDSQGDLWVGFYPSGVDRFDALSSVFQNYRNNPTDPASIAPGGVMAIVEDESQNLWIGSGRGLSYFDRKQNRFKSYYQGNEEANGLLGNACVSLLLDRSGELWVGSWSKGVNRMSLSTGVVTHYVDEPGDETSLFGVEPWDMIEDSDGDIWIVSERGVSRFIRDLDQFQRYQVNPQAQSTDQYLNARVIMQDRQGYIWIGADHGLFRLDKSSGIFTHYPNNTGDVGRLRGDFVRAIFEDSTGKFWLGTQGGGLNLMDRETGEFQLFGENVGLAEVTVTAITEDHQGMIWFTTLQGGVRLNVAERNFRRFNTGHGLLDNLFNRNAAKVLTSGQVALGSSKGLTIFDPQNIQIDPHAPRVVFTDLQVLNQSVHPKDENSPLQKNLLLTKKIVFKPKQSVFTFEFSALNFHRPQGNHYAYRLQGFDSQWHHIGNKRSVTYTNLDPGKYQLQVRAANSDGIWSAQDASMDIIVLPPWWRTWWAYGLYFAFVALIFLVLAIMQFKRGELLQERRVNAKLRKLDKIKDTFLANTSHELRTPLNGMIGIADALIDGMEGPVSDPVKQKLEMIKSCGKRLANLVNDILDYAKLTEHSLEIRLRPVELNSVLHDAVYLLRPLAESKELELEYQEQADLPWVMSDENRLQQVLINLIGNAIKFTEKGKVTVHVTPTVNAVCVRIEDTGIGIPEEDVNSVFIAFHQLDSTYSQALSGTGLGLAITKQLVEMQGGEIGVTSKIGQGSCFWFTLQKSAHGQQKVARQEAIQMVDPVALDEPRDGPLKDSDKGGGAVPLMPMIEHPEQYCVLIVDDDPVNRIILRGVLEQHKYQVLEASNGQQALDLIQAKQQPINLVLLDVMMPRISGFVVCEQIREIYPLHELPVLFLTAHKNDEDLQKGFLVGGNEFLTKPVSKYELLALVGNYMRLVNLHRQTKTVKSKHHSG